MICAVTMMTEMVEMMLRSGKSWLTEVDCVMSKTKCTSSFMQWRCWCVSLKYLWPFQLSIAFSKWKEKEESLDPQSERGYFVKAVWTLVPWVCQAYRRLEGSVSLGKKSVALLPPHFEDLLSPWLSLALYPGNRREGTSSSSWALD